MGRGEAIHTHMIFQPVLFSFKSGKKRKKSKQMILAKLREKIIARKLDKELMETLEN